MIEAHLVQHSCKGASGVSATGEPCRCSLNRFEIRLPMGMTGLTEDADAVSFVIVLHEELVAVHYVLGEVPREGLVKYSSRDAEERRDYTRLKVCPDASLFFPQFGWHVEYG